MVPTGESVTFVKVLGQGAAAHNQGDVWKEGRLGHGEVCMEVGECMEAWEIGGPHCPRQG